MESHFSTGTSVRVTGTVQGVNFRNSAKRRADELGLVGWVRNAPDGAVELLIGGDGPAVDTFISWCGTGPRRAEVASVDTRDASAQELAELPEAGFEVRR